MKLETSPLRRSLDHGLALVTFDPALTLVSANDVFYALSGCSRSSFAKGETSLRKLLDARLVDIIDELHATSQPNALCSLPSSEAKEMPRTLEVHIALCPDIPSIPAQLGQICLTDISSFLAFSQEAELERQKYQHIHNFLEDIVFEYDPVADCMRFTDSFQDIFGQEPVIPDFRQQVKNAAPEGTDIYAAFRPIFDDLDEVAYQQGIEYQILTKDDSLHWFKIFATILPDPEGRPLKIVGTVRNIHNQKTEQIQLADKARTDSMTGLLNKQATREAIQKALAEVSPENMGVLMMLDLDNFKIVNDTMGHLAGDSVLIQVSKLIEHLFRRDDIIGRVGGDEFHIYMGGVSDLANVRERAAILCKKVRTMFTSSNLGSEVSVSVGIAWTHQPVDFDELYNEADIALYRAKVNGKDRYEIYGEESQGKASNTHSASPLISNSARNSIVAHLVEMLFSTSNLEEALDTALKFIGTTLDMDRVTIMEKSLDLTTMSLTHEWAARAEWRLKNQVQNVPIDTIPMPVPKGTEPVYYCADTSLLSPEERIAINDDGVRALVQCSFSRDGSEAGFLRFEERSKTRIWSQQEIDALMLMGTLLSEFLRRRRSMQLLDSSAKSVQSLLDHLQNLHIFVIRKDDYTLLYYNQAVAEQFPRAGVGVSCYKAFLNQSERCHFCTCRGVEMGQLNNQVRYNTVFGENSYITTAEMLWENSIPCYIIFVTDHHLRQDEEERQRRLEIMSAALNEAYDNALYIDPDEDTVELLTGNETSLTDFAGGNYTAYHHYICDTRIDKNNREEVREKFLLPNLIEAFDQGVPAIEVVFSRVIYGKTHWKRRRIVPVHLRDGKRVFIAYNQDITDQVSPAPQTAELDDESF